VNIFKDCIEGVRSYKDQSRKQNMGSSFVGKTFTKEDMNA